MTPGREPAPPEAAPPEPAPSWLLRLADAAGTMEVPPPLAPPATGGRPSAVLVLFGDGPDGPDLLFIQRSDELRLHAGQPAFPGGAIDAGDGGPVGAALREAAEEVGLDLGGRRRGRNPARGLHRADRVPGRPGAGLVAQAVRGGARSTRARWRRWNASAWPNWPIPPPA